MKHGKMNMNWLDMKHGLVGYEPLFSYVWRIQGGCLAGYETHGKLDMKL